MGLIRGLVVALVLAVCSCAAPPESCGPANCLGCCSANGVCESGTSSQSCGQRGALCQACFGAQQCASGACVGPTNNTPTDAGLSGCLATGCAAGQTCNQSTTLCEASCPSGNDAECPQPGFCDSATKLCKCTLGSHVCGQSCVSNSSVNNCGTSCTACPAPTGGTATCDGTSCGATCPSSQVACGAACTTCPAGATQTACNGNSCVATACPSGQRVCDGACAVCPAGASQTTCSGAQCVASACPAGQHLCTGVCVSDTSANSCGTSCTPCPYPSSNGSSTCNNAQCGISCNQGYFNCGTECTTCPSGPGVGSTTCSGSSCVASSCTSGYLLCSGVCGACPANATSTTCSGSTCSAVTCEPGYTVCANPGGTGMRCCGLRSVVALGTAASHIGVAHSASGAPVFAWVSSGNLRVAEKSVDGGLTAPFSPTLGVAVLGAALVDSPSFVPRLFYVRDTTTTDAVETQFRLSDAGWAGEVAWSATSSTDILAAAVGRDGGLRVIANRSVGSPRAYEKRAAWTEYAGPSYGVDDIAVDGFDRIHAVFHGTVSFPPGAGLLYSVGGAADFGSTGYVTSGDTSRHAVAVDSSNRVHVIWTTSTGVYESTRQSDGSYSTSGWSTPVLLIPETSVSGSPDLVIDGQNRMHIAYGACRQSVCGVVYAFNNGTSWSTQLIAQPDGGSTSAFDIALSVSPTGSPAIIATGSPNGTFVYMP